MPDLAVILYHFFRTRYLKSYFTSRDQLENWQASKIEVFKKKVLKNSPFYKEYIHRPLSDFPIMTKAKMMEHFDALNTAHISKKKALEVALKAEETRDFSPMIASISVGLSSGTSGNQGLFITTRQERLTWAGILLAKALPSSLFDKQKIAFFLRANNALYKTLTKNNQIQFAFFDLTQDFKTHLETLTTYQPTIIAAPPSVLRLIAHAQEQKKITIHPQRIFSVAEVLDPLDEAYVSFVFGQKIHQIYQATEGFLAITDANHRLRLNEEFIHVEKEWIDSSRFVPIITDFTRTTQPIVRYRLDDILVEDKSQANTPFTYLSQVEGRCDDVCYLINGQGQWVPLFADTLRQSLIKSSIPFTTYQLSQTAPDCFTLALDIVPNEQQQRNLITAIGQLCDNQGCACPTITFAAFIHTDVSKKQKRIERLFKVIT